MEIDGLLKLETPVYVIVMENDQPHKMPGGKIFKDDGGPLVMEQYTRNADLKSIRERAAKIKQTHGKCVIAQLSFVEEV